MSGELQAIQKIKNSELIANTFKSQFSGFNKQLAISNLAYVVNNNKKLADCNELSIATSIVAGTALSLNANMGEFYVIPFNDNKLQTTNATFQIGYKGWIQLAIKGGALGINASIIYQGQVVKEDIITGEITVGGEKKGNVKIGVIGYIKQKNGFVKTIFMNEAQLHNHFVKFSKYNYIKEKRQWNSSNGIKLTIDDKWKITVLKQLISKWAAKTPEMEKAILHDSKVFDDTGAAIDINNEALTISNGDKAKKKEYFIAISNTIKNSSLMAGADKPMLNQYLLKKAQIIKSDIITIQDLSLDQMKELSITISNDLQETVVTPGGVDVSKEPAEKEIQKDIDIQNNEIIEFD